MDAAKVVESGLVLCWAFAGAMFAWRRPLRTLGVTLLAGAALGGAAIFADSVREVAAFVLPAVALHVLLTLPHGQLKSTGHRALIIGGYAFGAATGLAFAVGSGGARLAVIAAWVLAAAVGLPGAHAAYLRTVGLERQRLQWVGCGAAMAAEVALVVAALDLLIGWPQHPGLVAAGWSALVPLSLAASASPRLAARVDRLLVHTVSFTGLTFVTVAVYLVVVIGLGRVPDDSDRPLLALSMVAAAVAAAAYRPARDRLSEIANRLVYGERHAPDEVLRTFGSRLSRAIPMDELLLQLVESLKKTLALSRAEVWTGTSELLELTVSIPYAEAARLAIGAKEGPVIARAGVSGQAWVGVWLPALLEGRAQSQLRVAPVVHSGQLLGLIVVERHPEADPFTEGDDMMLTELSRQVALALHNVQLDSALQATLDEVRRANEELQASRARIVATADAERRKIERNLHDGAQQRLVALAVNLRLANDEIADNPETADELFDKLAAEVKETIAELRALAHGIYPTLLVDSGLDAALRSAAGRSPVPVTVDADGLGRFASEVEAAVYFCCLEAMQNAAKHAPDATMTLRLWEQDGAVRFEATDDGPGFDVAAAMAGHGYTNMNDRLGALGGSATWASKAGEGSTISGTIPVVPIGGAAP